MASVASVDHVFCAGSPLQSANRLPESPSLLLILHQYNTAAYIPPCRKTLNTPTLLPGHTHIFGFLCFAHPKLRELSISPNYCIVILIGHFLEP
uniref:Uncharacterized protein n=1 Tax=Hyaloperonospora arabidopsidis (strain Emoy2) TaxID=559515 RepID=M4BXC8_HYAAE